MRRRFGAALVAVFVVSRLVYAAAGIRFDAGAHSIQLLPHDLLEHDLVRSLWYLHSQPPLFNAFVGVGLHVPGPEQVVFAIAYLAMGIALALVMYALMLELAVPPAVAFAVAAVFTVSPTTVLYENWLLYTYPVALVLVATVWFFARFVRTRRTSDAAAVGVGLAMLGLSRASYHLVFVVAGAALLVFMCARADRRRVILALAIPVALVAGLYVKNAVVFGEPSGSTWMGMNLAHMMFRDQPPEVKADVAAGHLARQSLVTPFVPLTRYPDAERPHTGVPALDRGSGDGQTNYNNEAYIAISRQYVKDVTNFVRRHPEIYASRVARSYRTAFLSASDYRQLEDNRNEIKPAVAVQNRLLGSVRDLEPNIPSASDPGAANIAWVVVAAYGAVLGAGAVIAFAAMRRRRRPAGRRAVVLFGAALVLYSVVASNIFDLGDNNRFRFETDPVVAVVATALLAAAWESRRYSREIPVVDLAEPPETRILSRSCQQEIEPDLV